MNANMNIRTSESQNRKIYEFMLGGGKITGLEALEKFGCMRLASRISDIRKRHPEVSIKSARTLTPTGKRVAQYYIDASGNDA